MPPILTSSARVAISPATAAQSRFESFTTTCLSGCRRFRPRPGPYRGWEGPRLDPRRQAMAGGKVRARRVYEEPARDDGARVLVDRIWPRGMTKERAALDEWCKNIAPSTELRKWYGHDP